MGMCGILIVFSLAFSPCLAQNECVYYRCDLLDAQETAENLSDALQVWVEQPALILTLTPLAPLLLRLSVCVSVLLLLLVTGLRRIRRKYRPAA